MSWWLVLLLMAGSLLLGLTQGTLLARWWRQRLKVQPRAAMVRMRSGRRFRGALTTDGPWLVLARPELLQDQGQPALSIDGQVRVPQDGVEYVQVIPNDRDLEPWVQTPNGERRAV